MFMHPILLVIGLAAASLPVLVHFLTRPKPIRMPLSTIVLVSDALHQRRAKDRLRDFLVLLLRSLAVALLAIAIARPLLVGDERPSDDEPAERMKVVILDASQSMAAIDGATTRFDRARAAAQRELQYRSGLMANLLIASGQPGAVFEGPSANLGLLRQRLAAATVSAAGLDVARTLDEATRQFSAFRSGMRCELVIISDFQRANWARADFSRLPEQTQVNLISMASDHPPANVAIEQVRLSSAPTVGKPVTVLVDVANHSDAAGRVRCQAELGSVSRTAESTIQPRGTTTIQMSIDWRDAGWQAGEVRLVDTGDALPADDVLPIAVGVRPPLRHAIITEAGDRPGTGAFFVSQVLGHGNHDEAAESDNAASRALVSITPQMLDTPPAQAAGLWIVSDVESWSNSVAARVASWLRRGRPLLYIARGPVDANNLQLLRQRLGADMQPPVELIASLESETRRDLRIEQVDQESLPFNVFGDQLMVAAAAWRFGGGLPTRMMGTASVDAVAATLSDRSALLYFTDVGAGQLAVLNADLSRSNLAYQAGFVPMLLETINRLTEVAGRFASTPSGQPIVRELPPDVANLGELSIMRQSSDRGEAAGQPHDDVNAGRIQDQDGSLVWSWSAAGAPDVYWVVDGEGKKVWAEAVRTDPSEQDLRSLSQQVLQSRIAGGRRLEFQSSVASPGQADRLWVWATLAMLGCVIAELFTLFCFRS